MNSDSVPYTDKSDAELWHMVTNEDRSAFSFIFDQYSGLLFKFGLTLVGDQELVKDAIQDFFIYLWDHKSGIREIRHLRAYLLTAFRRFILSVAAKQDKNLRLLENMGPSAAQQYNPDGSDEYDWKADQESIVQEEIKKLPKRLQEVVFLRFYQGLSYEEITAITSLNYQVVRNTVHRAVKQLRSRILERNIRK